MCTIPNRIFTKTNECHCFCLCINQTHNVHNSGVYNSGVHNSGVHNSGVMFTIVEFIRAATFQLPPKPAQNDCQVDVSFQRPCVRTPILHALFSSASGERQPMTVHIWICCLIEFALDIYTGSRNLSEVNAIDPLIAPVPAPVPHAASAHNDALSA